MATASRGIELQQEAAQKPHALVVPWPAQGHINPMMHLSKKLAARGVAITFANTQFNHDRLVRSQAEAGISLPQQVDGQELDIRLVGVPDGLGLEEYLANDVRKQCQALIDLEPLLVKLVEELQPPVSCIIADVFVMSTPSVAKRFGIPHVGFWTQNAASYAAHVIFTQGYTPMIKALCVSSSVLGDNPVVNGETHENLVSCIPGCPPLRFKEVPTFLQPCDPSDFIFSYLIGNFQNVLDCSHVLLNTFHELEAASLEFIHRRPNMCTIGPILPSEFLHGIDGDDNALKHKKLGTSMWVEDEGCMAWLHKQKPRSVLYVSFGSITVLSAQQIAEFAAGLEASGCPILMVVRPAMMYGQEAVFPQGFAERMGGRAVFVEWAPQLEVLAHPAVGGFLTHCGWNSTLESICRGVPMLCWPYFADQMLDCRCVVDGWKVGLDFEEDATTGLVGRGEIEHKVRALMDDLPSSKEMRERVKQLSLAARKAVREADGPSHRNFESFVRFLFAPTNF